MKYIFILGAKHHFEPFEAAIKHFNISHRDIRIVILKQINIDFSDLIEKYQGMYRVELMEDWVFKDLIFDRSKIRPFCKYFNDLDSEKDDIILFSTVSFENILLLKTIINVRKIFLMDDGLGHFSNIHFYNSFSKYLYILKLQIKSLLYWRYLKYTEDFTYFTKHDYIFKNTKKAVKYEIEKIKNPLQTCNSNEIFFLGVGLAEAKIIDNKNYRNLLLEIRKKNENKKIIYIPHRKETETTLQDIEKLGFTIKNLSEPIEVYYGKLRASPEIICSLYTTAAIINLASLFTTVPQLLVYHFNDDLILKNKPIYQSIFAYLRSFENIKIEDI